jgi:transcriptional regulator with XRE-family HTH domain
MSLETLAGLVGRSKGWLSKIENGHARLERRQDIAAIAEALEVSADSLVGVPAPELRRDSKMYNLTPLRSALLDTAIDSPEDIPVRPVAVLADLTGDQEQARLRADFGTLTRELPGLISELQVHAAIAAGGDRALALRSLIHSCALATAVLKHTGQGDLAWVAADRGRQAAGILDDPAWRAAAAFECAHARFSANRSRALLSTPRMADDLEPNVGDDLFAREVYGMLRLSAALACAVQGNHDGARANSAEAARVAAPLGNRPAAFGVFGPANVGVWRASLAVEAGNAGEALTYAGEVEPRALASNDRRSSLHREKARAFAMLGKDAEVALEIRQAERLSPIQVHHDPLLRELVATTLARARREAGGRDLRGLAWRMNLI